MSVTLLEVVCAARARAVPLAAETAAYLLLSLSEKVARSPRRVDLAAVELDEDGAVHLLSGEATTPELLEQSLRQSLSHLLAVSSSPGPSLLRAAARPTSGQPDAFVAELERALVPVNRTAGHRALVRLSRETERARRDGLLAASSAASSRESSRTGEPLDAAVGRDDRLETPVVRAPVLPPVNAVSAAPSSRDNLADRTPNIGSIGLEVIVVPAPVVIEAASLSPDLPTAAPPPYGGVAAPPRGVGELVERFEVAAPMSDDSLRAELKRVAGVEGTPGPEAVTSRARRAT